MKSDQDFMNFEDLNCGLMDGYEGILMRSVLKFVLMLSFTSHIQTIFRYVCLGLVVMFCEISFCVPSRSPAR